jgi:hypothetical protein
LFPKKVKHIMIVHKLMIDEKKNRLFKSNV